MIKTFKKYLTNILQYVILYTDREIRNLSKKLLVMLPSKKQSTEVEQRRKEKWKTKKII